MIKISKIIIAITCLNVSIAVASNNCFIAKENDVIIKQIGTCDVRHSPFSTFKIAIALMGFDSKVLQNPTKPAVKVTTEIRNKIPSKDILKKYPIMNFWSLSPQTPETWMAYSVVWYSQLITEKLGMDQFKQYVKLFNYGNMDVSGTPNQNDGLLSSWLNNSLQISEIEQVNFIEKLVNKTLPVSKQAQDYTIKILKLETLGDNWELYGKTGGSMTLGRFVGWIEKGNRKIVFAQYVEAGENSLISGGRIAKEVAKDNLMNLMFSN